MNLIKEKLLKKIMERDFQKKVLLESQEKKEKNLLLLEDLHMSRDIIQKAAQRTQQHLEKHITNIVSLALQSIFDNPYEFKIEFVTRRNTTECDLLLTKDGKDYSPLESCGYGVADVCSFALRIAYWKLQDISRNTLILDEPFRFCDKAKHSLIAKMLKELSHSLGIQFIIVTHEQAIADTADSLFEISQKRNVSYIKKRSHGIT